MKTSDCQRAYLIAEILADDLCSRLPESFALAHGELMSALIPLAVRLVITERKCTRDRKHAEAFRKARREVREFMASAALVPGPQPASARQQEAA